MTPRSTRRSPFGGVVQLTIRRSWVCHGRQYRALPGGKCPRQRPGPRPRSPRHAPRHPTPAHPYPNGRTPPDRSPHHQILIPTRMPLTDLASPRSISSQPRLPGPDNVGYSSGPVPDGEAAGRGPDDSHPPPQHHPRMGPFRSQLRPLRSPALHGQHDLDSSRRPGSAHRSSPDHRLRRDPTTPARSKSRNRFDNSPRDSPGAPSAISLNVRHPNDDIAQDDERPPLGQQLRCPGDRAVLAIGPHSTAWHPRRPEPVHFLNLCALWLLVVTTAMRPASRPRWSASALATPPSPSPWTSTATSSLAWTRRPPTPWPA